MKVLITDFIKKTDIEKKILGNYLTNKYSKEVEILLVWHQKCDERYLKKFPKLKLIIRYGVGYENISINYLKKNKIRFANTQSYGVDEVSDTAISFLMGLTRKTFEYNDQLRKLNTIPKDWQQTIKVIKRTSDYKVCSIGAGRIGSSFLLKARDIGFQTYFVDPYIKSGYEKVLKANKIENIEEAIKSVDIISLHCPQNDETLNLINKYNLKLIGKREFYIINTARGGLVNLKDLKKSLINKDLKYATDVLDLEPPLYKEHFFYEWQKSQKLQNQVIINPHTAFYSQKSYIEMREMASRNALNFIKNKALNDQII